MTLSTAHIMKRLDEATGYIRPVIVYLDPNHWLQFPIRIDITGDPR